MLNIMSIYSYCNMPQFIYNFVVLMTTLAQCTLQLQLLQHHSSIIITALLSYSGYAKPMASQAGLLQYTTNGEVKFWQRLVNNMPAYFPYYASIMLHAFGYLLCFILCQYNRPGPTDMTKALLYLITISYNYVTSYSVDIQQDMKVT